MNKEATAKLKNLRQSPRKVRLVADLIRGKTVEKALLELDVLTKKASLPFKKLVQSATANAKSLNSDPATLVIKEVSVDEGSILYRRRYRARGRAMPIRKRTSHVNLVLGEGMKKKNDQKNDKKEDISTTPVQSEQKEKAVVS